MNPSTPSPEEQQLIKSAKLGSLEAFEQILFLYEKRIFNYVYRLIGQKQDAEDLTQDTFIKLYKNIIHADESRSFKSWVYKIATNTVYDWLRKKRGYKESLIIDDPENSFETIEDDDPYYRLESKTDLETAMARLKPIHRTVLLLFYQQELSYEEIAHNLAIPVNTVKTHLYRAKNCLKKELGNYV